MLVNVEARLDYCVTQAAKTLEAIPDDGVSIPRNVLNGESGWNFVGYRDWTSGFWPGVLWYLYEYTGEDKWRKEADKFTRYLIPLTNESASDHDLGFQLFCSAGNGYRLTRNDGLVTSLVGFLSYKFLETRQENG